MKKNQVGLPAEVSTKAGEIATIITIGTLIILGITSLVSNAFLKNKQTVKIKAATGDECYAYQPNGQQYTAFKGKVNDDGSCSVPENQYCVDNPSGDGCRGPCTECFSGECRYQNNLWPFCDNTGCLAGVADNDPRSCKSISPFTPTTASQKKCPIYENNIPSGKDGEECEDLAACTVHGQCAENICCIVNSTGKIGGVDSICAKADGECASGYAWMPKSALPKPPDWCTDGKLTKYGGCDEACCDKNNGDNDCKKSGEACIMPNGYCKGGFSCYPKKINGQTTKYKRACVGASCVWTSCDPDLNEYSTCCSSPNDSRDTNYSSCVKCGNAGQALCGGKTVPSTPGKGQSIYYECCARGMAKKILRTCTGTNNTSCTYDCVDQSNRTVDCGGQSYLANKNACVFPDKVSKINCQSPSLPSVSQLGNQQTGVTIVASTIVSGDVVKKCAQNNGNFISCKNLKNDRQEDLCDYYTITAVDSIQIRCDKCVPKGVKEDIACNDVLAQIFKPSDKLINANNPITGKLVFNDNLQNVYNTGKSNVKIYAKTSGTTENYGLIEPNIANEFWQWNGAQITTNGKKIEYDFYALMYSTTIGGANTAIAKSNEQKNITAGQKNVDFNFGGAAAPPVAPTADKTFTITGTLSNSKDVDWSKIKVVIGVGQEEDLGHTEVIPAGIDGSKRLASFNQKTTVTQSQFNAAFGTSTPTCKFTVYDLYTGKEIVSFSKNCEPNKETDVGKNSLGGYDQVKAKDQFDKEKDKLTLSPAPDRPDKITIMGNPQKVCESQACNGNSFDFNAIIKLTTSTGTKDYSTTVSKNKAGTTSVQSTLPCNKADISTTYELDSIIFTVHKPLGNTNRLLPYDDIQTYSINIPINCGDNVFFDNQKVTRQ